MAHRGLFSNKIVATSVKGPKCKVSKSTVAELPVPQPSTGTKKKRWGTPEEKYRRLCMMCLLCRMVYYVHSKSVVSDDVYDRLEKTVVEVEDLHRELIDPKYSPTGRPGSDNEKDYPRSVRFMWDNYKDDPSTWGKVAFAAESFISDARRDFGLEDSKNQKNLEKTT